MFGLLGNKGALFGQQSGQALGMGHILDLLLGLVAHLLHVGMGAGQVACEPLAVRIASYRSAAGHDKYPEYQWKGNQQRGEPEDHHAQPQ